jgi:hypothetical protein
VEVLILTNLAVPQKKIRIIEPLLISVVSILAIIYVINAVNAGDFLWFASQLVDAHPDRIIITDHGEKTLIQPGHVDYLRLSEAAHLALSEFNNTDLINLGFGENTLSYYETDGILAEFYYDDPLQYHAKFRVGEPTQLMVPLNGRHAGHDYFFRGAKGEWWFGAMRMAHPEQLYSTLAELGYLEDSG